MEQHGFAEKPHQKEKWLPAKIGSFCGSPDQADPDMCDP
jgi:hypothetical protein